MILISKCYMFSKTKMICVYICTVEAVHGDTADVHRAHVRVARGGSAVRAAACAGAGRRGARRRTRLRGCARASGTPPCPTTRCAIRYHHFYLMN